MNRKQLLVVALVVGLLLVGWMVGQPTYEMRGAVSFTWESDGSDRSSADPRPADGSLDATVECAGPLDETGEPIHVTRPGSALAGYAGWVPVYLEPNPCLADRAVRRRRIELAAAAVLVLGLIGLVVFRPRANDPEPGARRRVGVRTIAPGS